MVGAVIALFGGMATANGQARRDERKWLLDQRAAAYDGTLEYLLRVANRRSEFADSDGRTALLQEHSLEWFDDLVRAQFWFHKLVRYCDESQRAALSTSAARLDGHLHLMLGVNGYYANGSSIMGILDDCITVVTTCGREDIGAHPPGSWLHRLRRKPDAAAETGAAAAEKASDATRNIPLIGPLRQRREARAAVEPVESGVST
jgi:hypothetical protein